MPGGPAGPGCGLLTTGVILFESFQDIEEMEVPVVDATMDALARIRKELESGSPDLLRLMVRETAEALMRAEAEVLCNAAHGERTVDRVNYRNGYRERDWDTRAGTVELQIPKLRQGSYFPDWLLSRAAAPSRRW